MSLQSPLFRPSAEWPVACEADVVVVGAGPGGIAAATAAARGRASVVVIDRAGAPGGTVTEGNCPHLMGIGHEGRQIVAGLADEFVRRLDRAGEARVQGAGARPEDRPIGDAEIRAPVVCSPHGFRLVGGRMLDHEAVTSCFYTRALGAVVEDGRVTAVAVDRAEGPALVRGRLFIDATADAHLVHRAGGRTLTGSPDEAMTKTLIFDLAGVPSFDRDRAAKRFDELVAGGRCPVPGQDYFMASAGLHPGTVHVNFTVAVGDALRCDELTRMDRRMREQISAAVDWFRRELGGFENAYLIRTPSVVGVRGGRSAVGLETITQADVDADAPVAEPVAVGIRRYGDHGIRSFRAAWSKDVSGCRAIPRGALIAADLSNVALAGRSISVEPRMVTCIRYVGQCFATGQAAGTLAALAADSGSDLAGVPYPDLREALLEDGAILDVKARTPSLRDS